MSTTELILTDNEFSALIERLTHVQEFALDIIMSSDAAMRADITGISICHVPGRSRLHPPCPRLHGYAAPTHTGLIR